MKALFLLGCLITCTTVFAQEKGVGDFTSQADIGNPAIKGSAIYDDADQHYRLKGGGYNIWFNRDEFHYLYNQLKGNFILTANVKLLGAGRDPHRKIGWMLRESKEADAMHISATVHGDGLTVLQWRRIRGAYMRDPEDEIFHLKKGIEIIQLERKEKLVIMRAAAPGEPLQEVGRIELPDLKDEVLAGLFLCSHNPEVVEEGQAWNVRIEKTKPDNWDGYQQGYIGSRLELLNVFDGKRKIIHSSNGRFEAPNWMHDGKTILFNQDGHIYSIPVSGGAPTLLNTGSVDQNNNDHAISFDGRQLAISSHRPNLPGGGSAIYVLPITGGEPRLITDSTPSYLHGWNPNNKELVYVAKRTGVSPMYNIYKKSLTNGPEIALTNNQHFHVDGPEFTPDGKYIYYNSNETGTMQIWRMKPDGSGKEQISFDEYHNWFPHISPDGKWLVMLSFPPVIKSDDHPFYKRVMLRLMPVAGGAPKVIAYLYGGQGTINTPSWSPDSKQIAFVSNSE